MNELPQKNAGTLAFKVVLNRGGRRLSAVTGEDPHSLSKDWQVWYKLKTWVFPKVEHSRLFVFKTELDALAFLRGLNKPDEREATYEVWKCEVKTMGKIEPISWIRSNSIAEYWHLKRSKKATPYQTVRWPGSRSAKAVKLLSKVWG